MPTINDTTVVASAYDTAGNGGRKLVRLSNGWLVAVAFANADGYYFYKSIDNGATWSQLTKLAVGTNAGSSIVSKGTNVYLLFGYTSSNMIAYSYFDVMTVGATITYTNIESQTTMGSNSLAINDAGTELQAIWSSKNATYPNSFNLRYSKGTIAGDGSVAWATVEQVTSQNNTNYNFNNPTISLDKNRIPSVFCDMEYQTLTGTNSNTAGSGIIQLKRATNLSTYTGFDSDWTYNYVYSVADTGHTYIQHNPSAIFVPQSVNGLANGRIWVAWHGGNVSSANYFSVYVSYSDDGGVTWSSATVLLQGVNPTVEGKYVSITASNNGSIYVVFDYWNSSTNDVGLFTYSGGSWGAVNKIKDASTTTTMYPSVLFDLSISMSSPLFIYKDTAKVGFYGTWTVTTISVSVTQGSIGTKSDKNNLLSYAITTDGTMSTITEKVNGVTVGTKTATSGQSLISGLTQAQWDAVRFGKYQNRGNILSVSPSDWEQGEISSYTVGSTYSGLASTTRLRLINPVIAQKNVDYNITIANGYLLYIIEVDSANKITKSLGWIGNTTFTTTANADKLYFIIRKTDNTTLIPSDIITINLISSMLSVLNNTLTVEMGTDTWTYTFDKRLATDADILSAIKLAQDSQDTYLPAVKSILGGAIRAKGGTVNDTDSWDTIASAIGGLANAGSKKWASGSYTTTATYAVSGLTFIPSIILALASNGSILTAKVNNFTTTMAISNSSYYSGQFTINTVTSSGFTIDQTFGAVTMQWFAFE